MNGLTRESVKQEESLKISVKTAEVCVLSNFSVANNVQGPCEVIL